MRPRPRTVPPAWQDPFWPFLLLAECHPFRRNLLESEHLAASQRSGPDQLQLEGEAGSRGGVGWSHRGLIRNWTPKEGAQRNRNGGEPQRLFRGWQSIVLTKAFQVKDLKSPKGSVGIRVESKAGRRGNRPGGSGEDGVWKRSVSPSGSTRV